MRERLARQVAAPETAPRRTRVFLVGLSLIVLGSTAAAQDQSAQARSDARPNGFYLTSPLEISEGYDSGLVAGTTRLNDSETLLTAPTFAWFQDNHRTEFELDYDPEFEIFTHNSRLNSWNHASTMRLTHRINARWSLIERQRVRHGRCPSLFCSGPPSLSSMHGDRNVEARNRHRLAGQARYRKHR